MTENGFTNCLKAILADDVDVNESFDPDGIREVETFKNAEIMTTNAGLVVRMDDGTEFQFYAEHMDMRTSGGVGEMAPLMARTPWDGERAKKCA